MIRTNLTKGNGFEYFHDCERSGKKVSDEESFTQILKPGQNIVKKTTVDKLRSELMVCGHKPNHDPVIYTFTDSNGISSQIFSLRTCIYLAVNLNHLIKKNSKISLDEKTRWLH